MGLKLSSKTKFTYIDPFIKGAPALPNYGAMPYIYPYFIANFRWGSTAHINFLRDFINKFGGEEKAGSQMLNNGKSYPITNFTYGETVSVPPLNAQQQEVRSAMYKITCGLLGEKGPRRDTIRKETSMGIFARCLVDGEPIIPFKKNLGPLTIKNNLPIKLEVQNWLLEKGFSTFAAEWCRPGPYKGIPKIHSNGYRLNSADEQEREGLHKYLKGAHPRDIPKLGPKKRMLTFISNKGYKQVEYDPVEQKTIDGTDLARARSRSFAVGHLFPMLTAGPAQSQFSLFINAIFGVPDTSKYFLDTCNLLHSVIDVGFEVPVNVAADIIKEGQLWLEACNYVNPPIKLQKHSLRWNSTKFEALEADIKSFDQNVSAAGIMEVFLQGHPMERYHRVALQGQILGPLAYGHYAGGYDLKKVSQESFYPKLFPLKQAVLLSGMKATMSSNVEISSIIMAPAICDFLGISIYEYYLYKTLLHLFVCTGMSRLDYLKTAVLVLMHRCKHDAVPLHWTGTDSVACHVIGPGASNVSKRIQERVKTELTKWKLTASWETGSSITAFGVEHAFKAMKAAEASIRSRLADNREVNNEAEQSFKWENKLVTAQISGWEAEFARYHILDRVREQSSIYRNALRTKVEMVLGKKWDSLPDYFKIYIIDPQRIYRDNQLMQLIDEMPVELHLFMHGVTPAHFLNAAVHEAYPLLSDTRKKLDNLARNNVSYGQYLHEHSGKLKDLGVLPKGLQHEVNALDSLMHQNSAKTIKSIGPGENLSEVEFDNASSLSEIFKKFK